jgi:hypothetical protein
MFKSVNKKKGIKKREREKKRKKRKKKEEVFKSLFSGSFPLGDTDSFFLVL